jgi:hypothetical protein
VNTTPDHIVRFVKPIRLTKNGAKYSVHTWSGHVHELQVYERGGSSDASYGFEVDGDLARRGARLDQAGAFAAGMSLIQMLEAPPPSRTAAFIKQYVIHGSEVLTQPWPHEASVELSPPSGL